MRAKILITGSEGLVGSAVAEALVRRGDEVVGLDLGAKDPKDVRVRAAVDAAMAGCTGVLHLAAVSRVVWAEQDPERAWTTNVRGTENVLRAAFASRVRPWVVFASSREVYGRPDRLPVAEDAPLRPINVYGRAKVRGEELLRTAGEEGLRAAVLRLSNVYGSARDHEDRVVPAFARGAALGRTLRVDGRDHVFDFTHLGDVTRGILAAVDLVAERGRLPPIHLLTGTPTSLGELAAIAIDVAGTTATVSEAPPRSYDVPRFWGDPARAREILGWRAEIALRDGVGRLIADFRDAAHGNPIPKSLAGGR